MAAAAATNYPSFVDFDFAKWSTKPIRSNDGGKGKTVYLDGPRHYGGTGIVMARLYDDMPLQFPIRPNMNVMDTDGGDSTRLNLELAIPKTADALRGKCKEFDDWCVDQGYKANMSSDPKTVWYESLQDQLACMPPEVGRVLVMGKYKAFLRRGKSKGDKQYEDQVRIKADGWFPYIRQLIKKEVEIKGKKQMVVEDCVWDDRLVENGPVGEKETKFYLYVPKAKRYTPTMPCLDDDGKPIITGYKDVPQPDGTTKRVPQYKMRWVGPQDAKKYSLITPVVAFTKMYVSSEFGPTVVAKELYIKAAPPRVKSKLDGHDVDGTISAEDSLAALTATAEASEAANEAEAKAEQGEAGEAGAAAADEASEAGNEPASAAGERVGRKRKDRAAEEDDDEPAKKRKTLPTSPAPRAAPAPTEEPTSAAGERVGRKRKDRAAEEDEEDGGAKETTTKKKKRVVAANDDF